MGEANETSGDDMVVMSVDDQRCIGSGMCELLEEAVFEIDEDTNIAGTLGDGLLARARALIVADRCPAGAISFVEPGER